MLHYVHVQNERKKVKLLLQNCTANQLQNKERAQPLAETSLLPCFLDQPVNDFGDCMHTEVHLFVLSCQELNLNTSHATNTSMALQFSIHFVGVFYISIQSDLLSHERRLLICSKALQHNEKGIATSKNATVNQQPTDMQVPGHC